MDNQTLFTEFKTKLTNMWDKKGHPKDGQVYPLLLTLNRQDVEYKNKDTGIVEGKSIYYVNIGTGLGRFRHGETIVQLPDGSKYQLDIRLKKIEQKDSSAVTIKSTKFID